MIWPAANAPSSRGTRISRVPSVDANLNEFRTKGISDLAVQIGTTDHAHLSLVHGAEGIHRRPIRLPFAILLDDTSAHRVEGFFERPVARVSNRCISQSDRLFRLGHHSFVRSQCLKQPLPDLVAHSYHSGACARGGIGATSNRRGRQIAVADEYRNILKGHAKFFGGRLPDHGIGAVADLMARNLDAHAAITAKLHARGRWRHLCRIARRSAAIADQPVALGQSISVVPPASGWIDASVKGLLLPVAAAARACVAAEVSLAFW
jgi:hypothetical protein